MRLMHYLSAAPDSMGGYPWEIVLALAGIDDLETLREVWERLGIASRISREFHEEQERKRGVTQGSRHPQAEERPRRR